MISPKNKGSNLLVDIPVAHPAVLDRAAAMIMKAERPLIMLGAASSRPRLADALSDFVRRVRIPFFNKQMGKGTVAGGSNPELSLTTDRSHNYS